MENKVLHVVILNYNNFKDTIHLVRMLQKQQNINLEIIVVDNCSPDNSYRKLKSELTKTVNVKVLKSNYNGGYAYGNNVGLKSIENENPKYVAILNNDLIIDNTLLFFELMKAYEDVDNIGFIAPAQKTTKGEIYNHSAWGKPSFLQDLMMSFWIYRKYKMSNTYDLVSAKDLLPVEILPGSFLFTSYQYFKQIGFFDEGTFLFLEERILFDKVKESGKQNYLIKNLFYKHEASSTIDKEFSNVDKYKILYESLFFYTKNYRKHGILKSLVLWPFLTYSLLELYLISKVRKVLVKVQND